MVLSAKFNPRSDTLSEKELEQLAHARSHLDRFRDWFISEFGSVTCQGVQFNVFGRVYNIMDDEELEKMREYQQGLGRSCSEIAMKAALKVAEILYQEK